MILPIIVTNGGFLPWWQVCATTKNDIHYFINLYLYVVFLKCIILFRSPLVSRVRVSVTPCGFRGGRNGVWVGFSRSFSRFPLPQISFHHFSTLISSISFHLIRPCDGASGVVGRHPCYSQTYNIGLHHISSLDPTLWWTRVEDFYFYCSISLD